MPKEYLAVIITTRTTTAVAAATKRSEKENVVIVDVLVALVGGTCSKSLEAISTLSWF